MHTTIPHHVRELVDWLRHQGQQSGSAGALIEITGDVDAAVAAALAKEAFGENLLGMILPFRDTPPELDLPALVARHLGIRCETFDLTAVHHALLSLLPKSSSDVNRATRHWLRAAALRHRAASLKYLLIGSGNRSDYEIGRFPHPDDPQVDLIPTAHLLRTEVIAIAHHFGLPGGLFVESTSLMDSGPQHSEQPRLVSYPDLDAYLSGDFKAVSKEQQRRILALQQLATRKRRRARRFTHLGSTHEQGPDTLDEQETYDRSIEALTLISKAITSDQYLEDILGLVVMVTAEVTKSSVCSLWLLDEKEGVLRLRATQSIDREYLQDRILRVGEGVVGKVAAENRAYIAHNVLDDPIFKEKELARRMGLVSMLSVPMRVKDRVIGVINCYTSHPHVFSDLQMNVLTTVANQAAVAIENTELMVKTKVISEELERRKIIERAKDLLMKRLDLSGEEAYRWLQKRSMNTRKSMREVSEAVLLTMET